MVMMRLTISNSMTLAKRAYPRTGQRALCGVRGAEGTVRMARCRLHGPGVVTMVPVMMMMMMMTTTTTTTMMMAGVEVVMMMQMTVMRLIMMRMMLTMKLATR